MSASPDSYRSGRIWPATILTLAWLAAAGALLAIRRAEWWPLLMTSEAPPERISLVEVAAFFAGIFLPLAFLWLFVAAMLQRRELVMQRKELEETRAVLAAQQRELESTVQESVKESARQTAIMNEMLEASWSRTLYEEFSLRLYYLASYIERNGRHVTAPVQSEEGIKNVPLFDRPAGFALNEQQSSVDMLFGHFAEWLRRGVLGLGDVTLTAHPGYAGAKARYLAAIVHVQKSVATLMSRYSKNPQAAARLEGACLGEIEELTRLIAQKWFRSG
jgi:hypothetical protein